MLSKRFSRTDRAGHLLEAAFSSQVSKEEDLGPGPWRMTELLVKPRESGDGLSLVDQKWLRQAKEPILVLNATALNTGHAWQFTATWMGEPPDDLDERTPPSSIRNRSSRRRSPRRPLCRRCSRRSSSTASTRVTGPAS